MKKIVVGAVVAVVAVVGVAAVFLVSSLDSLVKTAIETAGSEVTGVPVRVAEVKISLTDGRGTVRGLTVGNPPGFKSDTAFRLGEITVAIDTGSVTKNPVVIREVVVAAPEVTYELSAQGASNIQAIQDHVAGATARSHQAKAGAADAKPATAEAKPAPKVVIDSLAVTGGKLTLVTPIPGAKASGTLGDIRLANIGRDGGGASPAQVAESLMAALTRTVMSSAASMGIGAQLDAVKGAVIDKVGGAGGKLGEGLKGILGGK